MDFIQAARVAINGNYFAARNSLAMIRAMARLQPEGREQFLADIQELHEFRRQDRGTCVGENLVEIWDDPAKRRDRAPE